MDAARRVVLVLWSCGPARADGAALAAAPFVYALAAHALELEVEMHFTADTVRWLVSGVADAAWTDAARSKTVADFIREARAAGVKLYACAMALNEHARGAALIAEAEGLAGAATVRAATVQADTRTLVF
ncbi:MAG: DsrE family protein [Betaproteobacteria bacterium]